MATSNKRHSTQQSLNGAVKQICDMRRSNCAGALQYVPELTGILFLRILDEREEHEAEHAEAVGAAFTAVSRLAVHSRSSRVVYFLPLTGDRFEEFFRLLPERAS